MHKIPVIVIIMLSIFWLSLGLGYVVVKQPWKQPPATTITPPITTLHIIPPTNTDDAAAVIPVDTKPPEPAKPIVFMVTLPRATFRFTLLNQEWYEGYTIDLMQGTTAKQLITDPTMILNIPTKTRLPEVLPTTDPDIYVIPYKRGDDIESMLIGTLLVNTKTMTVVKYGNFSTLSENGQVTSIENPATNKNLFTIMPAFSHYCATNTDTAIINRIVLSGTKTKEMSLNLQSPIRILCEDIYDEPVAISDAIHLIGFNQNLTELYLTIQQRDTTDAPVFATVNVPKQTMQEAPTPKTIVTILPEQIPEE